MASHLTSSGFVYQVYTDEYASDRIKLGENQSISIPDKDRVTAANMNPSGIPSTARRPYGSQTGFGDLGVGPFLQRGVMTLIKWEAFVQ